MTGRAATRERRADTADLRETRRGSAVLGVALAAALAALLVGAVLVWQIRDAETVWRPSGEGDRALQTLGLALGPALLWIAVAALLVVLVLDGLRRARRHPPTRRSPWRVLGDRSAATLAAVALVCGALLWWCTAWQRGPASAGIVYFGGPFDDPYLWHRLTASSELLAPLAAAASVAALVGLGIVIVARMAALPAGRGTDA